jgi:hypothetical protein
MGLFDSLFSTDDDDLDCDWYCDQCGDFMNSQTGFTVKSGTWKCEMCGFINDVTSDNIIDDYDDDDDERIDVYEAALIWASNGKDEDYTFGYSEDELEDAL